MRALHKVLFTASLLFCGAPAWSQSRYWVATAASNWSNTASWSTSSNGASGASVPAASNLAIFDGAGGKTGACNLDLTPTVAGITISSGYTGTIDLLGFTLTTTGTQTFTGGTISNTGAAATVALSTSGTSTFSGTIFNVSLTGTSGRIFFNGSVFNGTINVSKTASSTDSGIGGNTFNSTVTLTNTSTSSLQLAATNPDIFQGLLTVNLNNTGDISLARVASGSQFNNNVVINYVSTGGARFGQNGGLSVLANTRTITVGTVGVSGSGDLQLAGITQTGTTAQSFTLSGNNNAILSLGPNTTFNADLTANSPSIILQTATFNGTTQLTKTGTNTDNLRGGNLFAGTLTVNNQGGDFAFGTNSSDAGDTFNGTSTFNNTGGNRIRIAQQSGGTVFNGNATFNCLGSTDVANRIQISRFSGGSTTFNGSATFVSNGTASDIHISYDAGSSTTFNGPVYFTSNAIGGGDFFVGTDGNVAFTNNIEFNSTCTDVIYVSQGAGTVTFGNGVMTIGAGGFNQGQLRLGNFTQTGSTAQSMAFTGTASLYLGPASTLNGAVNFITPQIFLNGCTFNGTTYIEKNGASSNTGTGSNIFNGVTTLVNSGSGNFVSGSTSNDVFNNNLTLTNTASALIAMANASSGNTFGGNIIVNSTAGGGVYFGNNAGASATLASGKTITVGASGFSAGQLRLSRFTQSGATPQNLTLTGTALLLTGPSSQFDGAVTFIAPQLLLNGGSFNGTAYLEKNGATDNTSTGGNIYNLAATVVNSGSGTFDLATTNPDTFNSTLLVNNTGTYRIQIGVNSVGNLFNGDVTINHGGNSSNVNTIIARSSGSTATFNGKLTMTCSNTNSTSGIIIGNDGNAVINGNVLAASSNGRGVLFGAGAGAVTLANGFTVKENGAGSFNTGTLTLKAFTQVGNTVQNITLTGSALLTVGPSSQFDASVNFIAPSLALEGCTYNGTSYIEKNGVSSDYSSGGNVFNGTATLLNSGTGFFVNANGSLDTFNGQLTITNTGSNAIYMAHNVPGTVFNGNVIVNCTAGSGIFFCNNTTGSCTLASGKTIAIGGLGFTTGELRLQRFTQTGSTNQNLTLTGTGSLRLGPSSQFDGNVNFIAPQIYLHGATYNGTAYIEKNGASSNSGNGGNVFNGVTTLINSGSNYLLSGNANPDTFNAQLTLTNTGSDVIYMAHNVAGTAFNANVIVNSTGASQGVYFSNNTPGTSTLASGAVVSVGVSGFAVGELRLKRFTQTGTTAQNLTFTGSGAIRIGPSTTFNAAVIYTAPQVYLDGGTFNGTTTIQKNGAGNNDGIGGNIFNGTTTLTNTGVNRLRLAGTSADAYNGNVTFVRTGAGVFDVAYAQTNNFLADITVNSASGITFGGGGGTVQFSGGASQSISKAGGSTSPTIPLLSMAKSANGLILNTDLNISGTGTFTNGIITSTSTNFLNFAVSTSATAANNASYVDGPVRKTGNNAFTFPVGNANYYRPISMTAPGNVAHQFTAQYFHSAQAYGGPSTWDPSFDVVSGCDYWILDRTTGTSNVSVTLSWNDAACTGTGYITNPPDLRVARFNIATSKWVNEGNGGTTGTNSIGTIVSSAAVTTFSPFTLASITPANPLPVELGAFWATDDDGLLSLNWITYTELNNKKFKLQRSADGFDFTQIGEIPGAGNSSTKLTYKYIDEAPLSGLSYYRLVQVDFDGKETYSPVISVHRKGASLTFQVYPNPASDEWIHFNQKANIVVVNSLDQLIMTAQEVDKLDASKLNPGVYIIKNQKGEVLRFVKE
ncbi:MAG: T9SS type A sorting domain-containing protein [Chryseolinea sp.]